MLISTKRWPREQAQYVLERLFQIYFRKAVQQPFVLFVAVLDCTWWYQLFILRKVRLAATFH